MRRHKIPIRNLFLLGPLVFISLIAFIFRNGLRKSDLYETIPLATHSNGKHYIGSLNCMECHSEIYFNHIKTAHYKTSALADTASVNGSFEKGKNNYRLNSDVVFEMTNENGILFQKASHAEHGKLISKSKIDLVIGSGTKGQSYLNWSNDSLYQLQVSYFALTDSWVNSPGMPTVIPSRPREVNAKCMECHTTFAKNTSLYGMGNSYDKNRIIYGVDCERCHGPSREHVVFHRNNPQIREATNMMIYDTLSSQRRLDACALCHSGVRQDVKPAFEFLSGERLRDYSLPDTNNTNLKNVDVHGNQYALLTNSQCFIKTESMDCTTCHHPHKNQKDDKSYFNGRCIKCHNSGQVICIEEATNPMINKADCISCHMPLKPSANMFMENGIDSLKLPVMVRTHLIDIYIEEIGGD